jgi:hypothetical protein
MSGIIDVSRFRTTGTAVSACFHGRVHMVDKPRNGREWAQENAAAFAAQARWHELHHHPLEDIPVDPRVVSLKVQRTAAPRT